MAMDHEISCFLASPSRGHKAPPALPPFDLPAPAPSRCRERLSRITRAPAFVVKGIRLGIISACEEFGSSLRTKKADLCYRPRYFLGVGCAHQLGGCPRGARTADASMVCTPLHPLLRLCIHSLLVLYLVYTYSSFFHDFGHTLGIVGNMMKYCVLI